MTQIFEVITRHAGKEITSYYVANHINQVIKDLHLDLNDEATEVVKIQAMAPVLRILP